VPFHIAFQKDKLPIVFGKYEFIFEFHIKHGLSKTDTNSYEISPSKLYCLPSTLNVTEVHEEVWQIKDKDGRFIGYIRYNITGKCNMTFVFFDIFGVGRMD